MHYDLMHYENFNCTRVLCLFTLLSSELPVQRHRTGTPAMNVCLVGGGSGKGSVERSFASPPPPLGYGSRRAGGRLG